MRTHLKIQRPENLAGLAINVMGLGLHGGGVESARFCAQHGAKVTVTDLRDASELSSSIQALEGLPIRFVLGKHEESDFASADLIIKNPAVPKNSPFLASAALIETDLSLFLRFSPSTIIAITGTKGKSTISSAVHHALVYAGQRAFLGGNITQSPLAFLPHCNSGTIVVLELSSWQLADLKDKNLLSPKIALISNIMPDHMNRYASMEEYAQDKAIIFSGQNMDSWLVLDADDPYSEGFAKNCRAKIAWFSEADKGKVGAWFASGKAAPGMIRLAQEESPRLLLEGPWKVRGRHAQKNLLATSLVCALQGIDLPVISRAMQDFPGVEHRLEYFLRFKDVDWFNDSAATIPQATQAALEAFDNPVVLITGGTDKNIDFESTKDIWQHAYILVLLAGSGTEKLRYYLDAQKTSYHGPFDNVNDAVTLAAHLAPPGSTVLFSPGCTSFGMFANEFDRGRQFKAAARLIAHSHDQAQK